MTEIRNLIDEDVEDIFRRFDTNVLTEEDRKIVRAMMEGFVLLGRAVKEKTGTIQKLLKMLFGAKTEKADTVLNLPPKPKEAKDKPKGHGRNGADAYTGSEKVTVSHTLKTLRPVSGV